MPVYAGYVKRETPGTDWSGLIGDLGEKVQHAIDRPKRDRAARLSILEKNEAILNEVERGSDPTMRKVITDGVNNTVTQLYDWKKQADAGNMSRAEYNSKFNTVMSGYKAFSKASKGYVSQIEASSAREKPDPKTGFVLASPKEMYMNKYNAGLADLKNTSIVTNSSSGKIYLAVKDEQGNILSQKESESLLQYGNLTSDSFDLNGFLDVQTKGIKTWTIETPGKRGGSTTVEAASLNEENYIKVKNATIRGATNDINNAATILKNYGEGYDFYVETKDNTELNSILDETVENARLDAEEAGLEFDADKVRQEKFEKMIKLSPDGTGVMQPNITDKQHQASKDIVAAGFEMRMGRKETSIAERAAKTSGGDGGGTELEKGNVGGFYGELEDAWLMKNADGAAILSAKTGDDTVFKWVTGGLQPMKAIQVKTWDKENAKYFQKTEYVPVGEPVKNVLNLSSYFYSETDGKGQGTADSQMKAERKAWRSKKSGASTTTSSTGGKSR